MKGLQLLEEVQFYPSKLLYFILLVASLITVIISVLMIVTAYKTRDPHIVVIGFIIGFIFLILLIIFLIVILKKTETICNFDGR